MAVTAKRLTAQEYLDAYDGVPRTQLVEGEVVVNEPVWLHQRACGLLHARLLAWIESGPGRGQCGISVDVGVDDRNVYAPDVWWRSAGTELALHDPPPYALPDLAIEVRSPSTWRYDTGPKRQRYEQYGLPELWLVDTKVEVVTAMRRSTRGASSFDVTAELGTGDRLESPQLPGFAVPVSELFED